MTTSEQRIVEELREGHWLAFLAHHFRRVAQSQRRCASYARLMAAYDTWLAEQAAREEATQ